MEQGKPLLLVWLFMLFGTYASKKLLPPRAGEGGDGGKSSVHGRDWPPPEPSPARRGGNGPVIQKHYTSVALETTKESCAGRRRYAVSTRLRPPALAR